MIYVTGNIHADMTRFVNTKIRKLKKNDVLIICGDFGFIWDSGKLENKLLEQIGKYKFQTLFIDGTHENFSLLKNYKICEFAGSMAQHITGNLFHLLRGNIYYIENKKIFTFGGGISDDKDYRVENSTWWSEELPSFDEIENAKENLKNNNYKVDYILTHEPPGHIKSLIENSICNNNLLNSFFDTVSKETQYKKWFFGSYHIDKNYTFKHRSLFLDVLPLIDET